MTPKGDEPLVLQCVQQNRLPSERAQASVSRAPATFTNQTKSPLHPPLRLCPPHLLRLDM